MNIPIVHFISRKKKKKENRSGHMIKCLLTELGRAGQENIWPSFMAHGPSTVRSVRHDLGPNIFPFGPPTQSISTYVLKCLTQGQNQSGSGGPGGDKKGDKVLISWIFLTCFE